MCTTESDIQRDRMNLILAIQRLIDSDVLLPDEGRELLGEIEAIELSESSSLTFDLLPLLEALTHTDRMTHSVMAEARSIVRQILHGNPPLDTSEMSTV